MKILIVCSINSGKIVPFILEQTQCLKGKDIDIDFYTISQKGFLGYLKSRKGLLRKIKEFNPEIIHAHYGLSGLLANLQRKIPVVTTYHGSDINNKKILCFSKISILLSKFNLFVSQKSIEIARPKKKYELIPCGINLQLFKPLDKKECRQQLGFSEDEKLVLFSSSFDNRVKNPVLAQQAVELLPDVRLIELKGYTREQVCQLMNAVDAVLMTSFTEGSPQFIKEAMACNCPIVSVDVGDVKDVISGIDGCFISPYKKEEIATRLQAVFDRNQRTDGRERIMRFDNEVVTKKIIEIYKMVLS